LLLAATAATAGRVDMSDPRRALGREDDVRIDAELAQETLSPNSPISVTYQVQNLSSSWIAIADKVVEVTFDADERALDMTIGAEVPSGKMMPHMVMIAPGEKKTLSAGGSVHGVQTVSGPFAVVPREVQIRVNVLRDLTAFRDAIARQSESASSTVAVTTEMFDKWLDANHSIFLNALPVRWSAAGNRAIASAADPTPTRSGGTW
jgi:hypothetical protein